jgi:hypothetical protein
LYHFGVHLRPVGEDGQKKVVKHPWQDSIVDCFDLTECEALQAEFRPSLGGICLPF